MNYYFLYWVNLWIWLQYVWYLRYEAEYTNKGFNPVQIDLDTFFSFSFCFKSKWYFVFLNLSGYASINTALFNFGKYFKQHTEIKYEIHFLGKQLKLPKMINGRSIRESRKRRSMKTKFLIKPVIFLNLIERLHFLFHCLLSPFLVFIFWDRIFLCRISCLQTHCYSSVHWLSPPHYHTHLAAYCWDYYECVSHATARGFGNLEKWRPNYVNPLHTHSYESRYCCQSYVRNNELTENKFPCQPPKIFKEMDKQSAF